MISQRMPARRSSLSLLLAVLVIRRTVGDPSQLLYWGVDIISSRLEPLAPLLSDPISEVSFELDPARLPSEFRVGLWGVDSLFMSYWSLEGVSFCSSSKIWNGP